MTAAALLFHLLVLAVLSAVAVCAWRDGKVLRSVVSDVALGAYAALLLHGIA